ncbi:MAG: SpoIIE family protein phosphatase [bacterium]
MARLVVESGADKGMIFPLNGPQVTLGRGANNTIQIVDRRMSRNHTEIRFEGNKVFVKDLESKNGTYLNSQLLKAEKPLRNGDRLRVGETTLVFETDTEVFRRGTESTTGVRLVPDTSWVEFSSSRSAETPTQVDLDTETSGVEAIHDSHHRLEILYQVADAIRSLLNIDELLQRITNIIFNVLLPDRCLLMLFDERLGELVPRVIKQRGSGTDEIALSSSIVDKCLKEKVSILVSDAASDYRFKSAESIVIQKIRSALCSPLIAKDEIFGVIYIDTKSRVAAYGEDELELLTGIANQSAMAIANAKLHQEVVEQHKLQKEMEIARSIQMNLLPRQYPTLENFEISAMSLPAKKVGGDYYDFLPMTDSRMGIVVADVSGKVVPAALMTATVRAALQVEAAQTGASLIEIMERINRMACRDSTNHMFVTMVFGFLNDKEREFEYVNAGHSFPLLFSRDGKIQTLEVGGCFLGMMQTMDFRRETVKLPPGSTLALYTDGVSDTMNQNGETFGVERLRKLIQENLELSAEDLRDLIYNETLLHRGEVEQFDDFTLVILRSKD